MARMHVYFNLHRHVWSLQLRGIVVGHREALRLLDVDFKVRKGGHSRVVREGRKNVHAFAVGDVSTCDPTGVSRHTFEACGFQRISYNPFRGASFYHVENGLNVAGADEVVLLPGKQVYARGIRYAV